MFYTCEDNLNETYTICGTSEFFSAYRRSITWAQIRDVLLDSLILCLQGSYLYTVMSVSRCVNILVRVSLPDVFMRHLFSVNTGLIFLVVFLSNFSVISRACFSNNPSSLKTKLKKNKQIQTTMLYL